MPGKGKCIKFVMSRTKKYLIIVFLFLTIISVGFTVFLITQNQGGGDSDVSVTTFGCSAPVGGYWIGASGNCNFCQSAGVGVKASDPKMCCNLISKSDARWNQWGCGGGGGDNSFQQQCLNGFPRSRGTICNPACGTNACDGDGPLACSGCPVGTVKQGQYVCMDGDQAGSCGGQVGELKKICNATNSAQGCGLKPYGFLINPGTQTECSCTPSNQQINNSTCSCQFTRPQQPAPTCSDGIRNGNETGVDCGGSCRACSNVTPSGTIPAGRACTPGLPSQCVAGTFCTLSPGNQYLCNPCTNCGNNFCPAGETCGRVIGFKCTGDFGQTCDLSDPGVQVFEDPGLTWNQAVALVAGCGQVDVVCTGNKQGCGDFQIFKSSCGTGTTPPPGNPPPTNLQCNSLCGGSLGTCTSGLACTTVGSESRCRLPANPTSQTCSPVVVTPFCGDAICQAGELCERVGTTGAPANEFRRCDNNQAIPSCRNLATSAPSLPNGCTFCGDGVYQSGVEQCDASAPPSGGNDPVNCNSQCQTVAPICVGLTQNPSFISDTISSGVGNIVEYELTYQNASTTNPYPNIRLRVADPLTPTVAIGRDADNPTNSLVAPAVAPTRNATNSTWTYRFRWEAADITNVDVPDGTYNVRVLLDGTNATAITSPAGCLESITVDAAAAEEPIFTVVKQGSLVCQTNNNARIEYTITVTNVGPVPGSIDFVRDTLDSGVVALGITPTDIVPSFGVYSAGQITWVGTPADRAFTPGQVKTYTYAITIPAAQVTAFRTNGVNNTVQVQYDTGTTTDNVTEFDLTTPMTCSVIVIPVTSIFTDSTRFLLLGMVFMIGGYIVYRYRIGAMQVQMLLKAITRPLNFEEMVLHDKKFRIENKRRK